MEPEAETTFPEAVARSMRDLYAAEFDRAANEIDAVAKWIDGDFSVHRDVLGGEKPAQDRA